jgi:hypothetical protein
LSLPVKGSLTSKKENLLAVWKQTKRKPKELEEQPPLPPLMAHFWGWYMELHNGEKLRFSEIESWGRLTGRDVTPQEVEILKTLNSVYLTVQNGRHDQPSD